MRALDQPWPGPFGVGADTLSAGDAWRSPRERTITEGDVDAFAHVSGDHFALHTDPEWAATTRYGARIAHGLLVLSAASGLWRLEREVVVAFYGLDRVRFVAPVHIGDTLRVELTVVGVRPRDDDHALVEVEQRVLETGDGGQVCACRLTILARRRLATAEGVP
jgi:3-hydroxybutyryl-CoA dehydratase